MRKARTLWACMSRWILPRSSAARSAATMSDDSSLSFVQREKWRTSRRRDTSLQMTEQQQQGVGYHTKSIVDDLAKKGTSNVFSEASSRTIQELGNIELFELGEIPKNSSLRNVLEMLKRRRISAHVVYVLCRGQNRPEKSKTGSRSCQIHSTS